MTPLGSPPAPSPLPRGTAQQDLAFLLGQLVSAPQALVSYLEHVGAGKSLRQVAREMKVYPSTILRQVRRMENLRDHPYADFLLENWVAAWANNTTEGLDLGASWVLKSILIQAAPSSASGVYHEAWKWESRARGQLASASGVQASRN